VYGLTSAACLQLNAKCGKLGGPLGAKKAGRYPVFFKGEKGFKQIKPCNLQSIADPGRGAVAGHEVDALQSVVVGGVTGTLAVLNSTYVLSPAHVVNAIMMAGKSRGAITSTSQSPSSLGLHWEVANADATALILDPTVTLNTPTWITGSPPEPWLYRDATITSFNPAPHEHTLVFHDLAQTTLHLRLNHLYG